MLNDTNYTIFNRYKYEASLIQGLIDYFILAFYMKFQLNLFSILEIDCINIDNEDILENLVQYLL
jgi:hypothetical protein